MRETFTLHINLLLPHDHCVVALWSRFHFFWFLLLVLFDYFCSSHRWAFENLIFSLLSLVPFTCLLCAVVYLLCYNLYNIIALMCWYWAIWGIFLWIWCLSPKNTALIWYVTKFTFLVQCFLQAGTWGFIRWSLY